MKFKLILLAVLLLIVYIINYISHYQNNTFISNALFVTFISIIAYAWLFVQAHILKPAEQLKKVTGQCKITLENEDSLSKENIFISSSRLVSQLYQQNNAAIEYVRQIEKGNLEATYPGALPGKGISEDTLASALVSLSKQLRIIAGSEKERSWATEGLARFADILRNNSHDITSLSDQIITQIVKYLKANQGSIFLYNENPEPGLDMISTYAFGRKKYGHKRIEIGQGLLGQAYLEKQYVYLTDIPTDYIHITSGLGEATPRSLLIVPLLFNEQVLGLIEIASFHCFEKYQINFLEKLSESIASTFSNVKVAEQTQRLLEESQQYTQLMRSQEEEMRQNMEELIATQENQQRLQQELKLNEESLQLKIAELEESKRVLEQKETELKMMFEKSQKKSSQFKAKMEQLDMELEGKDAMIHVLKQEKTVLLEKLSSFETQ